MASQNKVSISIMWSDPVDLGGSPLLSYLIEMDSGTSGSPGVF